MHVQTRFEAKYEYGEPAACLRPSGLLERLSQVIFTPFRLMAFPGGMWTKYLYVDRNRVTKSENQLCEIGGIKLKLKTPDGDTLSGIYLKTNHLKKLLLQYFDLCEVLRENKTVNQQLRLKSTINKPDELKKLYTLLEGVGVQFTGTKESPIIELGNFPVQTRERSAVILGHGSAISSPAYKHLALFYLLNGVDVLLLDMRGYGNSTGSPTSKKTLLDFETAYQYLHQTVKTQNIWVHAHCLSGGAATDLCSRRRGLNLVLDRSFADYQDLIEKKSGKLAFLFKKIGRWIIDYDNAAKIEKVTGHICLIGSPNDRQIAYEQTTKLIDHLPIPKNGQKEVLITILESHNENWVHVPGGNTQKAFLNFLKLTKTINKI